MAAAICRLYMEWRRVRLSWLVSALMTFAYFLMGFAGVPNDYAQLSSWEMLRESMRKVREGDVEFDARYIYRPPNRKLQTAMALNLPAVVPGLGILGVARTASGRLNLLQTDLVSLVSMGAFVPALWWLVGRRLDRILTLTRRFQIPLPGLLLDIGVGIVLLVGTPILLFGFAVLAIALFYGETGNHLVMVLSVEAWSGWAVWIALERVPVRRGVALRGPRL